MKKHAIAASLTLAFSCLCLGVQAQEISYEADCPVLYAYHCVEGYYVDSSAPGGIYSFTPNQQLTLQLEASAQQVVEPKYACYGEGRFYAFTQDYAWSGASSSTMYVYDAATWSLLDTHTWENVGFDKGVTYNPADGKLYTFYMYDGEQYVSSIDPVTYNITPLVEKPWGLYMTTLFAGPDNRIYHLNTSDYCLYYTDLISGENVKVSEELDFECTDTRSAVYDFQSGKAYFSCSDYSQTHIYSIDIEQGTMTSLATLPEHEYLAGLYLPYTAPSAPDAVSHLLQEGATGSISFLLPSQTYAGEPLEGSLQVSINVDGAAPVTLEAEAGASMQWNSQLTSGTHHLSLIVSNEAGSSPERRLKIVVGSDVPGAVTQLKQQLNAETGTVDLTWKAPTKSKEGKPFNDPTLAYRIVRNPQLEVVAEGLTECSFTDQLSDAFAHYSYTVTPYVQTGDGVSRTTEEFVWGTVNVPPFTETFDYYEDADRWTTVNPLEDGYGWWIMMGDAFCMNTGQTQGDYYLFSPQIRLSADQTYTLCFDAKASGWDTLFGQVEVSLTQSPTADAAATPLLPMLTLQSLDATTYYTEFMVEESGIYYLSFHDMTPSWGSQVIVDNVTMLPNSLKSAPAGVSSLLAKCQEKGSRVAISFCAPTATLLGEELTSLERIDVVRLSDGALVQSFAAPAPGEELSCVDTSPKSGRQIYQVTAYDAQQKGLTLHTAVYVGLDVPTSVIMLAARQSAPGEVVLTWDYPGEEGLNGGYVEPQMLNYKIYRKDDLDGYSNPCIKSGVKDLTYTDNRAGNALGHQQQRVVQYQVSANNAQGEGPQSSLYFNVGTPYTMQEFAETFASASYQQGGWLSHCTLGKGGWSPVSGEMLAVKPYVNDGGMLQFVNQSYAPTEATLLCPRIALDGAQHPMAVFYVYHGFEAEPEDLLLTVLASADDAAPLQLATIAYNDGRQGWQRHEVDLTPMAGATDLQLRLQGYAFDNSASIFVDNLTFSDKAALDLELTHAAFPESVSAVQPALVSVTVTNVGTEPTATALLRVLKEGEAVDEADIPALEPASAVTLQLAMHNLLTDAYTQLTYQAVLEYADDMYEGNNASAPVQVNIKGNTLPTVELAGTTTDGSVSLQWEEPVAQMAVPLTDGFETYSPWASQGFGPWTTYDADLTITYWLRYWPTFGNHPYGQLAFEVWNNREAMAEGFFWEESEFWPTRSGESVLAAFTSITDPITWDTPIANDNWLISPSVAGGTDVSFWINKLSSINVEYVELYYSIGTLMGDVPEPEEFTLIRRDSLVEKEGWKQITATLPREAEFFAIRHCTQTDGYILLLDDITYTPETGSSQAIHSRGYNVYRDGEFLATTSSCSYTDTSATTGTHTYAVTTLWDEGESTLSNSYITDVEQGIHSVDTDAPGNLSLYTLTGTLVWSGTASQLSHQVPAGIYLMRQGDRSVKVIIQ